MEATEAFSSIHDGYAYQKLNGMSGILTHSMTTMTKRETECVLGSVTDKAKAHMKRQAEEMAKEKAASAKNNKDIALQMHKFVFPCPDVSLNIY